MLILVPTAATAAVAAAGFALSVDLAALPLLPAALAVVVPAVPVAAVPAAAVLSGDSGIRPSSDGLGGSGGLAQPSLPGGKLYSGNSSNSSDSDGDVNSTVLVQNSSQS
jgi:hypothetical protein